MLLVVLAAMIWFGFLAGAPSCFDGKQDGAETGVDCGGTCSLLCPDAARAPVVLWARAMETASSTYTAVAYVQNNNPSAAARAVKYSFQLFDADNKLVVERDGVTDVPPEAMIPILETSIDTGNRDVTRALFSFASVPVWNSIPAQSIPQLRVSGQMLSADGAKLSATIDNTSLADAPRVAVVAVLFDANGVAQAASKSIIPVISHQSSAPVVFTWPRGNPNIVRAEITILPSF